MSSLKGPISTDGETSQQRQLSYHARVSGDSLLRALGHVLPAVCLVGLLAWNLFLACMLATELRMNDFGRFYYSGLAFLQGHDMYGPRPAEFAQIPELQLGRQFGNMNPPHFHLIVLPLALLPPLLALCGWGVLSASCLYYSLKVIYRESALRIPCSRYWLVALGLLSFTGTQMMLVTGQLSWVLFLPITLAWAAARQGRWSSAGTYLGFAMSVKPFLLIFLPYLVLQRQWRAAVNAGMTLLICFATGVLIFGIDAHRSWLVTLAAVDWTLGDTNVSILGFLTRVLSANSAFSSLIIAPELIRPLWLVAASVVGMLTFAASTCSSDDAAIDRGFALVLLAALLLSPLGWTYYLWFPLGPLVVLLQSWWGERQSNDPFVSSSAHPWRDRLLFAAIPGLVWPFLATGFLQPHSWATVVFGSVYFWSTLFLWAALVADWRVVKESIAA